MVFVLDARGEGETTLYSIRPETPAAEAEVRARFARVKESWNSSGVLVFGRTRGGSCGNEGGQDGSDQGRGGTGPLTAGI